MSIYTSNKIIKYMIFEFFNSMLYILIAFFSLALLINFIEEITFFKDIKIENFIIMISYLSIIKTPNTIIELVTFIALFSGILFFSKIKKNGEISTALLSGMSKKFIILIPAIIGFLIGILVIFFISPLSSSALKYYEKNKRIYLSNENLIVINSSGLWFMEKLPNSINIIKADRVSSNDFLKLKNVTIYKLDSNFNFLERFDSEEILIENKNWKLINAKFFKNGTNETIIENSNFSSSIDINDLKSYFSNASAISFWDIKSTIQDLNNRGYSASELKIKLHKYISLPIYLFSMIIVASIFTIGIKKEYNTLMYLFFGLSFGFIAYFLNDLSIAVGLSDKIPLTISVWSPVLLITFMSIIYIVRINER